MPGHRKSVTRETNDLQRRPADGAAGGVTVAKTYLFWDPLSDNILQERDETGAVTAEYTTESGLYGNVISQKQGGLERQFHYDAQGSTLAVTDDNQQVTDTRAYSAFGETTESTGSTVFPFQYVGQKGYYYAEPLSHYVRRRHLVVSHGRWMSVDPISTVTSILDLYGYAVNSPLNHGDPSGLGVICHGTPSWEDPILIATGGIFVYGNWCGFRKHGPLGAIDCVDAACQAHDLALQPPIVFNPLARRLADCALEQQVLQCMIPPGGCHALPTLGQKLRCLGAAGAVGAWAHGACESITI